MINAVDMATAAASSAVAGNLGAGLPVTGELDAGLGCLTIALRPNPQPVSQPPDQRELLWLDRYRNNQLVRSGRQAGRIATGLEME
jgi:hypothetical protein